MIKRTVFAAAIAGLTSSNVAHAEVLQYHPNSPAYIGGNFDPSYPGRAYPECLKRTFVRAESLLPGQKPGTPAATQFFLKKVSTRKELYRLLNVSLAVSGSYGLFSADFSGSLEQENTFSEETFTWIIQGYSNFGKFILEDTTLNSAALALANNPVGFRNRCGTDFVGQEVRAAQATAVFTIKNLSESERKVLEASFSASYGGGPLSIGGNAKYSEFVKTAATFGQIEVKVYAIGGPGVAALAPIITNVDKPDVVLKTIQDYFSSLTLDQSVAVAYNTGSLQSLINRPSIESDVYNKYIADIFTRWEDLGAEQSRLRRIASAPDDWGLTVAQTNGISAEIKKIEGFRKEALTAALACKNAFTNVNASASFRRSECVDAAETFLSYQPAFKGLSPKPYYLRYFVSNELIPGEEVLNFSVRGAALKSVKVVKKLAPGGGSFADVNSIQIKTSPDGSREAGTSIIMKDIPDPDLPVGLRVELDSGTVYFETFAFTRAPIAIVTPGQLFSLKVPKGLRGLTPDDKAAFVKAQTASETLPSAWVEVGNKD